MRLAALPIHTSLADQSRVALPLLSKDVISSAVLVGAGALTAVCVVCFDLKLRLPGHAILRGIFPMAVGLALAPRRGGGTVMGLSAVASALLLQTGGGFRLGPGSLTSLACIGPCLDVCLGRVRSGWRLYGSFVLAGLICNLIALTVRAAAKFGGWDAVTTMPFASWWLRAVGSYTACGIIAGLISAMVWFRFSTRGNRAESVSESTS